MIVVNDVTQADDLSYSVSQSKSQSSITPFHKVLQGEVKARTQSADTADSAAIVCENDPDGYGEEYRE